MSKPNIIIWFITFFFIARLFCYDNSTRQSVDYNYQILVNNLGCQYLDQKEKNTTGNIILDHNRNKSPEDGN